MENKVVVASGQKVGNSVAISIAVVNSYSRFNYRSY